MSDFDDVDGPLDTLARLRARYPDARDPKVAAWARRMRTETLALRAAATTDDERADLDQILVRVARLEALTGEGAS